MRAPRLQFFVIFKNSTHCLSGRMKTFKELPWSRISLHTSDRKQPAYATHHHTMKPPHFTSVDDSNRRPRAAPFRQRLHGYTQFHPQKELTCRPRKQDAASTVPRVPGYLSDREEAPPIAFLLSAPFPNRARKNALESAPVQSPLRHTQSAPASSIWNPPVTKLAERRRHRHLRDHSEAPRPIEPRPRSPPRRPPRRLGPKLAKKSERQKTRAASGRKRKPNRPGWLPLHHRRRRRVCSHR
ncbi:unnamed protein product, partial [Ectocarpus sp. 8 AP-2014]